MSRLRAWRARLSATLLGRHGERELAEELESHLQLHIDEAVRHGATPGAARREALLRLGGLGLHRHRHPQPVAFVLTLESMVADASAAQRMSMWLLSSFAALAALLAAMGIYGVLAHLVLERRHEVGIRLALGAQQRDVSWLLLRRLALIAGGGIALGVPAAWAAGTVMGSVLSGVAAHDARLLVEITLLLAAVALLATPVPLRRLLATDPMLALRDE